MRPNPTPTPARSYELIQYFSKPAGGEWAPCWPGEAVLDLDATEGREVPPHTAPRTRPGAPHRAGGQA
jgi:hypothetical protein